MPNEEIFAQKQFWQENMTDIQTLPQEMKHEIDMGKSLRQLRNTMLGALFVINIMWFLLLYTIRFSELGYFLEETRAFQLLFLAVYAFLLIIQFLLMLCHRVVTFIHYIGAIRLKLLPWKRVFYSFDDGLYDCCYSCKACYDKE